MRCSVALFLVLSMPVALWAKSSVSEPAIDDATASQVQPVGVKDLTADQVQQALSAIQQKQVNAIGLDEEHLTRATLLGLLEEFRSGAELVSGEAPKPKPAAFQSEVLADRVGYIRLGDLNSENVAQLDAALHGFVDAKVDGVILDLRTMPESQDFAIAADVVGRFVPNKTTLFALTNRDGRADKTFTASSSIFSGLVVVLVNEETRGAAEAIAAALRQHVHAMIVGVPTSGRGVEFENIPLGEGRQLRLATRKIKFADGTTIYPEGVMPDVVVEQSLNERERLLADSAGKSVKDFIFEESRVQFNEAALMEGTNPEIEEKLVEEGKSTKQVDRPLQRAMDMIVAIRFFKGKI